MTGQIPSFLPVNAQMGPGALSPTGPLNGSAQVAQAGGPPTGEGGMGSRIANARLGDSWHGVASGSDYNRVFGNQSYVKDLADPQLLSLIQEVLAKAPELQGTSLATNAQAGKVTKEDIQTLQKFLESKGCSVGSTGVDGKYGPRTHKALEGFLSGQGGASGSPAPGEAPRPEGPATPTPPQQRGRRYLRPRDPGEEQRTPETPGFQTLPYRVPADQMQPRTIEV